MCCGNFSQNQYSSYFDSQWQNMIEMVFDSVCRFCEFWWVLSEKNFTYIDCFISNAVDYFAFVYNFLQTSVNEIEGILLNVVPLKKFVHLHKVHSYLANLFISWTVFFIWNWIEGETIYLAKRSIMNHTKMLPYSPVLWCMHLYTKPRQWCMHQKWSQSALFFYLKNIGAFSI